MTPEIDSLETERLEKAKTFALEGWSFQTSLVKAGFKAHEVQERYFRGHPIYQEILEIVRSRGTKNAHLVGTIKTKTPRT